MDVKAIAARHGLGVDSRFKAVDAFAVRAEIERLGTRVSGGEKLRLLCWCSPKRCHADAIAAKIVEMAHAGAPQSSNQVAGQVAGQMVTQNQASSSCDLTFNLHPQEKDPQMIRSILRGYRVTFKFTSSKFAQKYWEYKCDFIAGFSSVSSAVILCALKFHKNRAPSVSVKPC